MRGHDDSGLIARKIRDLITLGGSAVAESATEVFSCAYEACSVWDGSVPSYKNGALTTGQKYDAEYAVADDLTDLGPMLFRQTPCIVTKFRGQRKMAEVQCLPGLSQDPDHLPKHTADTICAAVPWKICGHRVQH